MTLTPLAFALLVAAAAVAGFVDSIAGGGGIITLPIKNAESAHI